MAAPGDRYASPRTLSRHPQHPAARRQRLDMLIGIFGFFTLAAFVVAVLAEVQGKSALREAVVLLFFAVLLGLVVRARRRS